VDPGGKPVPVHGISVYDTATLNDSESVPFRNSRTAPDPRGPVRLMVQPRGGGTDDSQSRTPHRQFPTFLPLSVLAWEACRVRR